MKISEIKSSIGRRCRMEDPHKWSWTMPWTGTYIIRDYAYVVSDSAHLSLIVQCEHEESASTSVWVDPKRIILIDENGE